MRNHLILLGLMALMMLLVPIFPAYAATYSQNQPADIKYINPAETNCNITIISPNGLILTNNYPMQNNAGYFNYTFLNTKSIGIYNTYFFCAETITGTFEVTQMGLAAPGDNLVIFAFLLFIGTIGGIIYMIVYSLERFGQMKFDMKDLIYNIIAYIALFVIYIFNANYIGNISFDGVLKTFIAVGVFSTIAAPVYMFMICYFRNVLDVRMNGGQHGK
jgi:hypothetical protein